MEKKEISFKSFMENIENHYIGTKQEVNDGLKEMTKTTFAKLIMDNIDNVHLDIKTVYRWFKKKENSKFPVQTLHAICSVLNRCPSQLLYLEEYICPNDDPIFWDLIKILNKYNLNISIGPALNLPKQLVPKDIENRLYQLRSEKNLSLQALASEFNCSKIAIWNLEQGENKLTLNMLHKYKKYFNVSLEYILYGNSLELGSTCYYTMYLDICKLLKR